MSPDPKDRQDDYRRRAAELEKQAQSVKDEVDRQAMLELAASWLRLAEMDERIIPKK